MRRMLVDASAFITLAEIGKVELLRDIGELVRMPDAVVEEIQGGVAAAILDEVCNGWIGTYNVDSNAEMRNEIADARREAGFHLGIEDVEEEGEGDLTILTLAIFHGLTAGERIVVVTDDKPLRKTCKALGVPISGSIGVLIAAVERGDLEPDEAKDALVAMDEVGARLSARLLRKAERLIDEAAERRGT